MDLEKFNRLDKILGERDFETNYSLIDKVLYFASFLGNIASVAFAFFFLNTILVSATDEFPGKSFILPTLSIVALSTFELLKRFIFKKLATSWVSISKLVNETIFNLVMSAMLISGSFYLSLSGAEKFADKDKQIVQTTEISTKQYTDSINVVYDGKIEKLEVEKKKWVELNEATWVTSLKKEYNKMIVSTTNDIKGLEVEKNVKIKEIEDKFKEKATEQKDETGSNKIAFILICTFIELLILIGVWFDSYYDWRCYSDFKDKLAENPAYHNFILNDKLLNILYGNGKGRRGDKVLSVEKFGELILSSGIRVNQTNINDFMVMCLHLNIIADNEGEKSILKTFIEAKETLKEHFNF